MFIKNIRGIIIFPDSIFKNIREKSKRVRVRVRVRLNLFVTTTQNIIKDNNVNNYSI